MATTYQLITAQTLTSTVTSVTFSSIPQTYDHLIMRISARTAESFYNSVLTWAFNAGGGTYTYRFWQVRAGSSDSGTNRFQEIPGANQSTNVFSANEVIIPNYTKTMARTIGATSVVQSFTNQSRLLGAANYWNDTAPITQIVLSNSGGIVSGSTFRLYGLKNS
jgi:hypothetical protein